MFSQSLTFDEFLKLKKQALHKIDYNLYDQRQDNRKINEVTTKKECLSTVSGVNATEITSQTENAKIHAFEPFKIPDESRKMIFGSSITVRIRTKTTPDDTVVPSYRGSSTEEKIRVLS